MREGERAFGVLGLGGGGLVGGWGGGEGREGERGVGRGKGGVTSL